VADTERIVDCHAHIIDPQRFPFTGTKGYQPRPDEQGTREAFCAVLDAHGIGNGVLVWLVIALLGWKVFGFVIQG